MRKTPSPHGAPHCDRAINGPLSAGKVQVLNSLWITADAGLQHVGQAVLVAPTALVLKD